MNRFLVIGGGSIGKRHIRNLKALGYGEVACLKRTQDPSFAEEMGVEVLTNIEGCLDFAPDAVIICTPTSLHLDGIDIAMRCKAHIFMEKPLIHDRVALDQAIERMHGYDKVFFIGFMLRFHPLIQVVKEWVDGKQLGNVWGARFEFGSFLPYWHPWEDHRTGYAGRKDLGGGVINTITHELDLVLYLFGSPASIKCSKMNVGKLDIDVEEIAEAHFIYADKLISLHVDYLQKDYDRNIKIWLDEGVIKWNWHENKVSIKKHKGDLTEVPLVDFDVNQLYLDELEAFIQLCATNQKNHSLDFTYAVSNTEAMLAMHQDAAKNS
jgi:predicted dehydrogenase